MIIRKIIFQPGILAFKPKSELVFHRILHLLGAFLPRKYKIREFSCLLFSNFTIFSELSSNILDSISQ